MTTGLDLLDGVAISPSTVATSFTAIQLALPADAAGRLLPQLFIGETPFLNLVEVGLLAGIKIGGNPFPPSDIKFEEDADASSVVTGTGTLPKEDGQACTWSLRAETRVDRDQNPTVQKDTTGKAQDCYQFYFKTTVTLSKLCTGQKAVVKTSSRVTLGPLACVAQGTTPPPPEQKSKGGSSGKDANGNQVDITEQPDGTRVTTTASQGNNVKVDLTYPDGQTDSLSLP